jgi:hypothetical protein
MGVCIALVVAVMTPSKVLADPLVVQSDTKLIPSLTITERYDSNVFFTSGGNTADYVTTVSPQLMINHAGHFVSGSLLTTLTGEAYVKNPGLNYIAPSGALRMNLDNLIGQVTRRAKLTVTDSFSYTPKPLAFLGPESGNAGPETFVRGVQAQRANSLTNVASVIGSYSVTPWVTLQGSYMYSIMRFGTAIAPPGGAAISPAFFNTKFQNYSIGPQFQVTPLDVVSITYQGSRATYSQGTAFNSGFQTEGATLGWVRTLTPTLTANASGGITKLGTGPTSSIQYMADASLQWKYANGTATLKYSRSVFPSFFIAAVPLLSQVLTASATYALSGNLTATGSASYARNEAVSGFPLSFISYSASVSLTYSISRMLSATASFTHMNFDQRFLASQIEFDRNLASISLRGEWN